MFGKITNPLKTAIKWWTRRDWHILNCKTNKKLFITTPFDLLHLQPTFIYLTTLGEETTQRKHTYVTPFSSLNQTNFSSLTNNLLITNTALRTCIKPNEKKETKSAKRPEKFSNVSAELSSRTIQTMWNFFQQNFINTFSLPNSQNR